MQARECFAHLQLQKTKKHCARQAVMAACHLCGAGSIRPASKNSRSSLSKSSQNIFRQEMSPWLIGKGIPTAFEIEPTDANYLGTRFSIPACSGMETR